MTATVSPINQNSAIGAVMLTDIIRTVISTKNGLLPMDDDTQSVLTTTLSDFQKQIESDDIVKNSLFDGNGYAKSNGKGETESEEMETTKIVVVDDSKINTLLPIERIDDEIDLEQLNYNEKELRKILLDDLKKAQFYTVLSLYYYIKVGLNLLNIQKQRENHKGSLQRIIQSVGLNERTAYRYVAIAKDGRFAKMTEEQFKSLHHLTQSKMIMMTKFKDEAFYSAINDEDFVFPTKKKMIEIGTDIKFDKGVFETFKTKSKEYVINEYNNLYIKYIELENKLKTMEAK